MRAAKAAKDGNNRQEGSPVDGGSPVDELLEALLPLINYVCGPTTTTGAFVAVRLLEHFSAPEEVLQPARAWLNGGIGDGTRLSLTGKHAHLDSGVQPVKPTGESPKKQRPGGGKLGGVPETGVIEIDEQQNSSHVWHSEESEGDHQENANELFGQSRKQKQRGTGLFTNENGEKVADNNKDNKLDSRRRRFTVCAAGKVDMSLPDEDELLELLRKVPALRKLGDDDLKKACKVAKCQKFDTDQAIVALGTRNDELHIVLEGKAGISVPHPVRTLTEGQYFGNEHLLPTIATTEEHCSAVHGSVTTISISAVDFDSLHITRNHVDKAVEGRMARNFANVNDMKLSKGIIDGICQSTQFPVLEAYKQTDIDIAMIEAAVKNNNVMGDVIQLCETQRSKIAEMVYLVDVKRDQEVIIKGTRGSTLYIVQEGLLDVTVEEGREGEFKFRPGEAFGELGLLYDAPRAVTISAASDCKLWVLTRASFQTVIRTVHSAQITQHATILKQIPFLLSQVAEANIDLIADMAEEMLLLETEEVCVEGEDQGQLYAVFEGRCEVVDAAKNVVRTLNKGDWVGEKQLELNIAAEHTVRVVSESAVILCLDMQSVRMATATATSLGSTVLFEEGQQGQIEKTRQAHDLIDQSLKKALKSYEKSSKSNNDVPELKDQTIIGGLGEGSFGLVYLLEYEPTQTRYAIKVTSKAHILREQMGNMMKNERDIMMLLDSDFIVRLYRTYHDQDYIYLLLEPITGGELFDVYNDKDLFCDLVASKFYIACVIVALEHLHEKRVIYRDLKLENCLLDKIGYVKLTDMGIAKVVVGKTYTVCGTADYLAPETLRQLGHNRAVDWWAVSVLLFIMCSGRSPFDAPDVQQIYKNIIKGYSKVKIPDAFPSDLIDVIKSLGRKKPEERLTMQKGGVENLKEMPYFTKLDWQGLANRELQSPFLPGDFDIAKVREKKLSKDCDLSRHELVEWDGSLAVNK